jgi:GMP reductase
MANEADSFYCISISTGVNGDSEKILKSIKSAKFRVDFITIDVAHGHHQKVIDRIKLIKDMFEDVKVIAGNVVTSEACHDLEEAGADAIKIGIGGGSICTTRHKTGFHIPTLQAIADCSIDAKVPLIADGGAKHYGDVAKALSFGATMVMSGYFFASCIDSPAKINFGKKMYRGSTSFEVKNERQYIEGISLNLDQGCTYLQRMGEIEQALKSSISYAGGEDLSVFNKVEYVLV